MEEINEDPIIEKYLEVEMAETIKEDIKEKKSQWNLIIWLLISKSFYFGGKRYTKSFWFY